MTCFLFYFDIINIVLFFQILHSEILRTRNPAKRAGIINLIAEAKAAINADLQKNDTEEQVTSNE